MVMVLFFMRDYDQESLQEKMELRRQLTKQIKELEEALLNQIKSWNQENFFVYIMVSSRLYIFIGNK